MDFKKRLPTRIDTHLYLSPKLAATFVTLLAISYGSTAVAAPADQQAAERQAQELQRQAQERANQQYEQDRQSARESIQLDAIAPPTKAITPNEQCWNIQTIAFKGVTLLDPDDLQDLQNAFSNTCIGISGIESLLGQVTARYIEQGYITARAYLPEQDLSSGTLIIEVLEGQIEGYLINGDKDSISLNNVAPGEVGQPFNLRDLEQTLDQINRLASNNASFQLLPGDLAGGSKVLITNVPSKPWNIQLKADNHGSASTGKEQLGVTYSYDNPLGLNDFISVTHRRAPDYLSNSKMSFSNSLTYVVPYRYSTFNVAYSDSEYISPFLAPSGSVLTTDGYSQQFSFGWDYLAYRDQNTRFKLTSLLTQKTSKHYLEDILLEVSSRSLTVLDTGISLEKYTPSGSYSLQVGHSLGLPSLGALRDPENIPNESPHAQFSKWTLGASLNHNFTVFNQPFSWSSQISGQYANEVLYGSEQLSIGSLYTVRGFTNNSIFGDHGIYIRNDLSTVFPLEIQGAKSHIRPYIGFDAGWVDSWNSDVPDGTINGMAFGISGAIGPVRFDLVHSVPLKQPSHVSKEDATTLLQINLSI